MENLTQKSSKVGIADLQTRTTGPWGPEGNRCSGRKIIRQL